MANSKEITNKQQANKENSKMIKTIELIFAIMEKTGWDHKQTIAQVEDAKSRIGINYTDFNKYNFHTIPIEMQQEEYKKILDKKRKDKEKTKINVESVMNKTGWDYDYAISKMREAKERVGIGFTDYNKFDFHLIADDEQKGAYALISAQKAQKKTNSFTKKLDSKKKNEFKKAEENAKYLERIANETGWSLDYAKKSVLEARKRTGCSYKEYCIYKFYNLTQEEQEEVFLVKFSRKITAKYSTDKEFIDILCDKEKTNILFEEYLKRAWCVNTKISEQEFINKFVNSKRIIYKPLGGNRGKGVEAFTVNSDNISNVFSQLSKFPEGVVEEYVVQHPDLSRLSPTSVNTVRIVTISSKEVPVTSDGKTRDIAYSSLRIGGGTSIVDNFHSGGMVANIDLSTGQLITDAADENGNVFSIHPVTGTKIKGFQIPFFNEAIEMVLDAVTKNNIEGYLGWDVAITENGPKLIEVNNLPGVVLLSMPYVAEKKGMKHVMAKYL